MASLRVLESEVYLQQVQRVEGYRKLVIYLSFAYLSAIIFPSVKSSVLKEYSILMTDPEKTLYLTWDRVSATDLCGLADRQDDKKNLLNFIINI